MIEIKKQVTISGSTADVWRVLAHEFDRVGEWATTIAQSKPNPDASPIAGAEVSGRICVVPGFGDLKESFTHYDEANMTFSYEAVQGMPFFVKTAVNTWSLTQKGNQTVVDMRLIVDVNLFPGKLMAPILRGQFDKQASEIVQELKYYIENGKPHPRKVSALQKAA